MAKRKKNTTDATTTEPKDKAKKFVELATKRMSNAIKHIRGVGKLSNKVSYEYSEEQISQMMETLKKEVQGVADRFKGSSQGAANFSFE